MNREQKRIAWADAKKHPQTHKMCRCGWLFPREVHVEQIVEGVPAERIRIVTVCPVCDQRATVEVNRSAESINDEGEQVMIENPEGETHAVGCTHCGYTLKSDGSCPVCEDNPDFCPFCCGSIAHCGACIYEIGLTRLAAKLGQRA